MELQEKIQKGVLSIQIGTVASKTIIIILIIIIKVSQEQLKLIPDQDYLKYN